MKRLIKILPAIGLVMALMAAPAQASAPPGPYFNGFETNTNGWFPLGGSTITRQPSFYANGGYASGIASASGNYHARLGKTASPDSCPSGSGPQPIFTGPYTNWGGYSSTFPPGGYRTQVDIYLDVNWAQSHPDQRFDWSSAINDNTGSFLRDFVFNAGTDPASSPQFFINASTNANRCGAFPENICPNPGPTSTPANACRTPLLITTSGWYTFRHTFRNDAGFLAVDFDILTSGSSVPLKSWTIHAGDSMSIVGGNRYGWFVQNEIQDLAIDNSLRTGACHEHDGNGDVNGKDSGKANFHSHAFGCEQQEQSNGDVEESDPSSGTNFQSAAINSAAFTFDENNQTVTMIGTGFDNGLPVGFTMVSVDNNGLIPGVFSLVLTDGYAVTGSLIDGSLVVQ